MAAALLGGATPAAAETLSVVTGNDFKPFSDQALPRGGLATAIVAAAFERAGDTLDIAWMDWQEGYDAALAGRFAATFPYYYTDARAEDYLYSKPFYSVDRLFFFNDDRVDDLETFADAEGRILCSPLGYALTPEIEALLAENRLTLEQPLDMTRCYELLALDRVDLVLTFEMQGWDLVRSTPGLAADAVAVSPFVVESSKLHVIAPRADERSEALLARFNAGLADLQADGTYEAILRRQLGEDAPGLARQAPLVGQEVRLTLNDGTAVQGRIEALEGGKYRMATAYGVLNLPTAEVASLEAEGGDIAARAAAAGDGGRRDVPDDTLVLAGSNVLGEDVIPNLVEGFAQANGVDEVVWDVADARNVTLRFDRGPQDFPRSVEIAAVGSSAGFEALVQDQADIAVSTHVVTAEEEAAAVAAALGDLASDEAEHVVGLDAVAVLVHPDNPVDALSRAQLRAIFTGQIRDWGEVGGAPGPIRVLAFADAFSTHRGFAEAILQGAAVTPGARRFDHGGDLTDALIEDPAAIGYNSLGEIHGAKTVTLAECGGIGAPSAFAVKTEDYPLTRRLYLYVPPARTTPAAAGLVEFAVAAPGQAILEDLGLITLAVEAADRAEQAAWLRRVAAYQPQVEGALDPLRARLKDARRLSATFRFNTASSRLDARSRRDLRRLVGWLRETGTSAEDLILVGYADGRGGYQSNRDLALRRAESVARALALEGAEVGAVLSMGEELPVACDDDAAGQARNRRVEVWLDDREG